MKRWWGTGQPVWRHPLYLIGVAAFLTAIIIGPPSRSWPWPFFLYLFAAACLGYLGWKKVDWNS